MIFFRFSLLLPLLSIAFASSARAHPMDLAQLNLTMMGDRLAATLELHKIVAERLARSSSEQSSQEYAQNLFKATLLASDLKVNGLSCTYLRPESIRPKGGVDFVAFSVVAVCRWNQKVELYLRWELPFLEKMGSAFQLLATLSINGSTVTVAASQRKTILEIGSSSRTFFGFIKMGMGHIGAQWEEWRSSNGGFQWPDGIDHIFFVTALTLAGGSLWALFKTATGFTLGHSLTLALSTLGVIHIHSKWVEVGIAFSIAYVAGRAFWRKATQAENWVAAALFGAIHGLGFAGALQDLELAPGEVLPALAGFNLGVELGQCLFILSILGALTFLKMLSTTIETKFRRAAALLVCLTGLYWVYYRAFV